MPTSDHPHKNAVGPTPDDDLSIGELAGLTGVGVATLRVWESRHGFPVPHRRESGHRRYDQEHVALVRDVQRRREEGVRLDAAIAQALAAHANPEPVSSAFGSTSVYATLRRSSPGLIPQRLTKATLLALSWAIEDELASRAERAHLFGAFQRAAHFDAARPRWTDLSRTMLSTVVFADGAPDVAPPDRKVQPGVSVLVPLPEGHPMGREWAVVCASDDLPIALAAREVPGQAHIADRDRVFESLWTVERSSVRRAARVCAAIAVDHQVEEADAVAEELDHTVGLTPVDLGQVMSLFNRIVAYVGDH